MRGRVERAARAIVDRPRHSLLAAAAAAISLAAGTTITSAAWTDNEWAGSAVGVSSPGDCTTNTLFTTQSWARQLSGTVMNKSLDSIAGVEGLRVTNNGTAASPMPATATPVPGTTDAFISKLPVTVLGGTAVETGLGLGMPFGGIGTYTQWAQARKSGQSHGASGLVSDQSGVIDVAGTAEGAAAAPKAASISLDEIVPGALGGVTLDVGAVASSASLDSCVMTNGWPILNATATAERDYGIASLDLTAEVPAVGALSSQGPASLEPVLSQLKSLTETGSLTTAVSDDISDIVEPLLDLTGDISAISTSAKISVPNASTVSALMTESMTDPDGVVTVDLAAGTVSVDVAALTDSTSGLNGMESNRAVVLDSATVATKVADLLEDWKTRVLEAFTLKTTTNITLELAGLDVTVAVNTGPSTLGQFLDGTAAPPEVTPKIVGLDVLGQLTDTLAPILGPITTALTSGANTVVKNALNATVFDAGLVPALGTDLQALITPVTNAIGSVITAVGTLVAIHVNVQPDQPWPGTKPADVTAAAGEYKVSALRVGLIDNAALLSLSLGSSSAGPVAPRVP